MPKIYHPKTEFKKGHIPWNKDKKLPKRKKHSEKMKVIMKEKWKDPEYRKTMSDSHLGEKCHLWIDGRSSDKDYIREQHRKSTKRQRLNPKVRLNNRLSTDIRTALKGKKAGRHWEALVGYTLQDLMVHLENLFDEKMNWENQGSYWQIDHVKPKSLFHYENAEDKEFKECWALSNLQPLEAMENILKSNKYTPFLKT